MGGGFGGADGVGTLDLAMDFDGVFREQWRGQRIGGVSDVAVWRVIASFVSKDGSRGVDVLFDQLFLDDIWIVEFGSNRDASVGHTFYAVGKLVADGEVLGADRRRFFSFSECFGHTGSRIGYWSVRIDDRCNFIVGLVESRCRKSA